MSPDSTPRPPQGTRIHIDVPPPMTKPYDVVVGAGSLGSLPARLGAAAPARTYALIVAQSVAAQGEHVMRALASAGIDAHMLHFADGEANKTRATWSELTDRMLALELGRDCGIVAIGGGVTGDVAGFTAATYMRGVPVVHVPTTLLSMIDASIGGKTGVDTAAGKNLVGAFHPPRLVLIDPLLLRTLPPRELRSGVAEAIKHGAILDVQYLDAIERNADAILQLEPAALEALVAHSVRLKAAVVTEDPYEQGRRAILNFGHTVGHAIERAAQYAMPHGFAVAAGMVAEAELGERVGVTEQGTRARLESVLRRFELPTAYRLPVEPLLEAMRLDKKAREAQPRFVLLRRSGACAADERGGWTHAVPREVLARTLSDASQAGIAV